MTLIADRARTKDQVAQTLATPPRRIHVEARAVVRNAQVCAAAFVQGVTGVGFALMAQRLAWIRAFGDPPIEFTPASRARLLLEKPSDCPASREYYRIIDKAWEASQALPGSLPMRKDPRIVL